MVLERIELPVTLAKAPWPYPDPTATGKRLSDAHAFEMARVMTNSQIYMAAIGAICAARSLYTRTMPSRWSGFVAGLVTSVWITNEVALYRFSFFVENHPNGRAESISDVPASLRYRPLWYPRDH